MRREKAVRRLGTDQRDLVRLRKGLNPTAYFGPDVVRLDTLWLDKVRTMPHSTVILRGLGDVYPMRPAMSRLDQRRRMGGSIVYIAAGMAPRRRSAVGHLEVLPPPRSNASCLIRKETSGRTRYNRSEASSAALGLPYRRRQSAAFQGDGAGQRPTVGPAGYANARFAVTQKRSRQQPWHRHRWQSGECQISTVFGEGPIQWN